MAKNGSARLGSARLYNTTILPYNKLRKLYMVAPFLISKKRKRITKLRRKRRNLIGFGVKLVKILKKNEKNYKKVVDRERKVWYSGNR